MASGRAMSALGEQVGPDGRVPGIDVTPAMPAAAARHDRERHGRPLAPGDLLAEGNLRLAPQTSGRRLDAYEDAPGHFPARARLSG
ncbi:hypothetical protein ACFV14_22945 [Streptomyces zaomyceticus]|uniref:hypothetical protein n=1 Tax=Streptomyces zaomyceticus TaxID=68286 RepID=UPI0036B7D495